MNTTFLRQFALFSASFGIGAFVFFGSVTSVPVASAIAQPVCKLQIQKSVNKAYAGIGTTLTYTLVTKNIGTANCTGGGVQIRDVVPTQLQYLSETHSSNVVGGYNGLPVYQASSRTLTWDADTLVPGEVATTTWQGHVFAPAVCGDFDITNTADVTSLEYNNFTTWVTSNTVSTHVTNTCSVPLTVSCSASSASVQTGTPVKWTATVSGGTAPYTYAWSGTDSLTSSASSTTKTYTTAGTKTASVTVADDKGQMITKTCGSVVVTTKPVPLAVSCKISPNPVLEGEVVSIESFPVGGTGSYTFSWTGTEGLSATTQNATTTYHSNATTSIRYAIVTVTSGAETKSATCVTVVTPKQQCNLEIDKTVGKTTTSAGEEINYSIFFKNNSAGTCTGGISLKDVLSPAVSFVSANHTLSNPLVTTTGVQYATSTHTLTFNTNTLGPRDTGRVNIVVSTLPPAVCGDYTIANTAEITTDEYDNRTTWVKSNTVNVTGSRSCPPPPPAPLAASCSVNVSSGKINVPVLFTSAVSGGNGSYSYSWSGTDGLTGSGSVVNQTYASFGTKNASVTVTSGSETITSGLCTINIIPDGGCVGSCGGGFEQPTVVLYQRAGTSSLASVVYVASQPYVAKVAGISLTQVPYTGVTGTVAVIIFILALVIWSMFVAVALESKRFAPAGLIGRIIGRIRNQGDDSAAPVMAYPYVGRTGDGRSWSTRDDERRSDGDEFVPSNLPTQGEVDTETDSSNASSASANLGVVDDSVRNAIFQRARNRMALVSEEASRLLAVAGHNDVSAVMALLDGAISQAEQKYLKEDGWILLNREKVSAYIQEAPNSSPVAYAPATPVAPTPAPAMNVSTQTNRPAVAEPIASVIKQHVPYMQHAASNNVTSAAPAARTAGGLPRIADFLRAIAAGDREQVIGYVRGMQSSNVSVEDFITSAILELDRVHRSRLENDAALADAEISRIATGWGSADLEEVINILLSIAEHSYKSSSTGLKLAVLRIGNLRRQ